MAQDVTAAARNDRMLPALCYILYLVGLTHGVTILIALVIAYANRGKVGPEMASHYTWIIRTFWLSIGWFLIGGILCLVGIPFVIVGIGLLMIWLGLAIIGLLWLWSAIRCLLGLVYLARNEAYPRPQAWLF